ncbi:NAD-binding protein [Tumebacillus lipolyticus]|uniref:NAD-binding protein n=1 Tax=Tumebacillus lipolyticus TaxID=1280370 RepID=A0ABW4ZWU0_9BACL
MNRCLIVTMDESAVPFVQTLHTMGVECAYLDFCAQTTLFLREQSVIAPVIKVGPHKHDVVNHEGIRQFDTAVVFEGAWLESALIVQALKQAGVSKVVVVAQNQSFMRAYRALGADRVVGVRRWNRDSFRVLNGESKQRGA